MKKRNHYNEFTLLAKFRTFTTKRIRALSKTRGGGAVISPTVELRKLAEGKFFIVDDAKSRRRILNAAARLGINVVTRKCPRGYEVHRVAKEFHPLYEYPI